MAGIHLAWVINDSLAGLVEACTDVDELLIFRRRRWAHIKHYPELGQFLWSLRRMDFDHIIDLQGLLRSGVVTAFAHSPHKVGFAEAREFASRFYHQRVRVPADLAHAVDRNLWVAGAALGEAPLPYVAPHFADDPAVAAEADALLAAAGLEQTDALIAVAPCSRWPSKTWPPELFSSALKQVLDAGGGRLGAWLLGSDGERPVGDQITAALNGRVANLMGRTSLAVMGVLLRRSAVLLANDSGPLHYAAALSIPCVALYGPTDPARTGPYGTIHRILQSRVDCAPCFHRTCPLPRQLCRDDVISPDVVAEAIMRHLDATPSRKREVNP